MPNSWEDFKTQVWGAMQQRDPDLDLVTVYMPKHLTGRLLMQARKWDEVRGRETFDKFHAMVESAHGTEIVLDTE